MMVNHQHKPFKQLVVHRILFLLIFLIIAVHTCVPFTFVGTKSLLSHHHIHHPNQIFLFIKPSNRNISEKLISTLFQSYQDNDDEREEKRKIKDVLNTALVKNRIMMSIPDNTSSSISNQKIKDINLELVSIGKQFDSYRRRFDYYSLLKTSHHKQQQQLQYDDNEQSDTAHQSSIWIRDNSLNVNVTTFLQQSRKLSSKEAKMEEQNLHLQSYHRQLNSNHIQSFVDGVSIIYDVNTLSGLSTTAIDQKDVLDYQKKISWEGDKYITELYKKENHNLFIRVEKYLSFQSSSECPDDVFMSNKMVLIVNSTLYYHDEDYNENLVDERDMKSINCLETFRPAYSIIDTKVESYVNNDKNQQQTLLHNQQYRRSGLNKVPGCTSNVNIYTTLVKHEPNESFQVMVDGESDTLLSRGLLAVLSSTLSIFNSNEILNIDPFTFADDIRLRSVLTPGRNDGLSNMVSVVQNQIRLLIENSKKKPDELSSHSINSSDNDHHTEMMAQDSRPKVAMLLSGGVDSAVALNLLQRQNYNVTAFYLKIWLEDELAHLGQCPWEDDFSVCMEVCKHAGNVPLETISLQDAYKERVISYTIDEAKRGFTPNPDIMCNSRIKFGCFYDAIADRDFDYVASGHYAQLMKVNGVGDDEKSSMKLIRAPDPIKDQSYFLAALRQDQLKRVLFPIGHLQKSEVRALAEEFDLPNKARPDSQGLCFLGKVKFDEFLSAYLGKEPGDIIDAHTGDIIGQHNGIWYHTVGQRKGIGKVLDPKATSRGPWYVVAKDPDNRKIIASNKYDEDIFLDTRSEFYVEGIRWISGSEPSHLISKNNENEISCTMKIRHGPTIVDGTLQLDGKDTGTVSLKKKDGGLAPGQFVVFYDDMECLGSGVISERHWLKFQTQNLDADSLSSIDVS